MFVIRVEGKLYGYATPKPPTSRELLLRPGESLSLGFGFVELDFRASSGVPIPVEGVIEVLEQHKWTIVASVVDARSPKPSIESNLTVSSNPLEFPLSREACESGIAC